MSDLDLPWNSDFSLAASGDLLLCSGNVETDQKIQRRLLTAVQGYVWHLNYGAGLTERIGKVALAANIRSLIRSNIALESSVATTPVPVITVNEDETVNGLFNIYIGYTVADSGEAVALNFEVPTS